MPIFGLILALYFFGCCGIIVFYIIISVYYSIKKTPVEERKIKGYLKFGLSIVFAVIFAICSIIAGIWLTGVHYYDFWKFWGHYEIFRFTIKEPFEKSGIEPIEKGMITLWIILRK